MENNLFYLTFGKTWKTDLIEALNVYDVCRNWPAYKNEDNLGLFALAATGKQVPTIGFGKTAKAMQVNLDMFKEEVLLRRTQGIAKYLNEVLANAGLPPRVWEKDPLLELFLNFDAEFRKYLVISVMVDFLVEFYLQLSREWATWLGGDILPGKVSPVTIWSNYANFELAQTRNELESLASMHVDAAVETFIDMQDNFMLQCKKCSNPAKFLCARCKKDAYCSKECARADSEDHSINCSTIRAG